jgi:predicted outer membrane repeat protein
MASSDIDALFVQGPSLSIRNSSFVNNSAEGGGAVSAASLFSINVAVSNFTGNQGFGGGGGAVAILTTQKLSRWSCGVHSSWITCASTVTASVAASEAARFMSRDSRSNSDHMRCA